MTSTCSSLSRHLIYSTKAGVSPSVWPTPFCERTVAGLSVVTSRPTPAWKRLWNSRTRRPMMTQQIALLRLRKVRPRCDGRYAIIDGRGRLRRKLEQLASDEPDSEISTRLLSPAATASSKWRLASSDDDSWLGIVQQAGIPLGRLVTIESGLSTGIDRLLLLKKTGRGVGGTPAATIPGPRSDMRKHAASIARNIIACP